MSAANPVLARAQATAPVVVRADPGDCSLQFDPMGRKRFDRALALDPTQPAARGAGVQGQGLMNRCGPALPPRGRITRVDEPLTAAVAKLELGRNTRHVFL